MSGGGISLLRYLTTVFCLFFRCCLQPCWHGNFLWSTGGFVASWDYGVQYHHFTGEVKSPSGTRYSCRIPHNGTSYYSLLKTACLNLRRLCLYLRACPFLVVGVVWSLLTRPSRRRHLVLTVIAWLHAGPGKGACPTWLYSQHRVLLPLSHESPADLRDGAVTRAVGQQHGMC